ncbi:MAG: zinc ribbon domain-containing protein [Acidobacteriota bacterium]
MNHDNDNSTKKERTGSQKIFNKLYDQHKSDVYHFVFCPHCGTRLQLLCPKCGKPVEENWQVCPHCGGKIEKIRLN